MKTVNVNLGKRSYRVVVGSGILARTGEWLRQLGLGERAAIITDAQVGKLYGERLRESLAAAGIEAAVLAGPESEDEKSLETAGRLYHELTEFRAERGTPVLALGGGVIGDLAGFVAATYLRGVPLVQVPTTLLAQADSSLGGKTAVNHGRLKNRVGTFYQPRLTVADVSTLKTLPPAGFSHGLCEVTKHGAIRDAGLFTYIEDELDRIQARDEAALEEIVYRSAAIKAAVVEQDEEDLGPRNILNFGHTVGHAVETVSNFSIGHGQAVAIGMVAAARISERLGLLEPAGERRLERLLERAGLLPDTASLDADALLAAMRHDKKASAGRVRFVLLREIGQAVLSDDVDLELVSEVLKTLP